MGVKKTLQIQSKCVTSNTVIEGEKCGRAVHWHPLEVVIAIPEKSASKADHRNKAWGSKKCSQ